MKTFNSSVFFFKSNLQEYINRITNIVLMNLLSKIKVYFVNKIKEILYLNVVIFIDCEYILKTFNNAIHLEEEKIAS